LPERLPAAIAASRTMALGGTWRRSVFPTSVAGVRAQAGQGRNRVAIRRGDDPRYFQISMPVQPGNSAGRWWRLARLMPAGERTKR